MMPTAPSPKPAPRIQSIARAALELGPGSLALYGLYQALLRSGWLRRRTPIAAWDERRFDEWLEPGVPGEAAAHLAYRLSPTFPARFFFEPLADLSAPLAECLGEQRSALLEEAKSILRGRFRLFGGPAADFGFPPPWHAFAPVGEGAPSPPVEATRHWSAYPPEAFADDVKLLWELSRFGWVFPLVRAYRLTMDERFARGCLELIESWRLHNPPNRGPHWFSGQEVALRILALSFAWHGLAPYI